MNSKVCDKCGSPVEIIKDKNKFSAECTYCGIQLESGITINEFIEEFEGE